jgi:hypothetical protein
VSTYSQRILKQRQRYRKLRGEWILFGGKEYKVFVESVSGAQAGEQAVPRETYSIYIASTDPSLFDFDPLDFAPNTAIQPPTEGSEFTRNNLIYVCSNVRYENEDTDTIGLLCDCLRKIWATPIPAPPTP